MGNPQVGKSCIMSRFVSDTFADEGSPTLGVSFLSKSIKVFEKEVKLNIWDTAGQERFSSLTRLYSRDAQVVLLVYDITSRESFDKLMQWHSSLLDQGFDENVIFAVVGNKEDLIEREQVSLEDAKSFAAKINAYFFKTSAKNSLGINELFKQVSEKAVFRQSDRLSSVVLTGKRERKKSCCG